MECAARARGRLRMIDPAPTKATSPREGAGSRRTRVVRSFSEACPTRTGDEAALVTREMPSSDRRRHSTQSMGSKSLLPRSSHRRANGRLTIRGYWSKRGSRPLNKFQGERERQREEGRKTGYSSCADYRGRVDRAPETAGIPSQMPNRSRGRATGQGRG